MDSFVRHLAATAVTLATLVLTSPRVACALEDAAAARMTASGRVGSGVVAALATAPKTRVMIAFDTPGAPTMAGADGRVFRNAAIAAASDRILARLGIADFDLRHRYRSVNAVAGEISAGGIVKLLDDPTVLRIDPDEGGTGHLAEAVPLVDLDVVQTMGFTGNGITVAVVDSGLDTDHPDLGDDLVGEECFCSTGGGCCPNGASTQSGSGSAEDDHGHGSNVTGIVTSAGNVAPVGGAPDAEIVAVKVLDENNTFCCSSDVVAAFDWILNNRPDVDVVNASVGTGAQFAGDCDNATSYTMAYAAVIDALRAAGVLVFVSAGNDGSGTRMNAPACVANAISVGAVWDADVGAQSVFCTDPTTQADQVTCFSNSNATTDVFAPGAPVTSAWLGGATSTFYGTSQASPLTAACAAALLEAVPGATPTQIEQAMESSSTLVVDDTNALSFPRLDCEEALALLQAASCTGDLDCDDADPCTNDICDLAHPEASLYGCVHTGASGPTCAATCALAPLAECRPPALAQRAILRIKQKFPDDRDAIVWKWSRGTTTVKADFGDPLALTSYQLCLYDGAASLMASASAPAGGFCSGTKPCWSETSRGYKYVDHERTPNGLAKIILKEGFDASSAKIVLQGKGGNLGLPALPLTPPVTLQLKHSDGTCWGARYTTPTTNETEQFKAKSD